MRIALFGGSFNPPHLAHQLACTVALASLRPRIDEVWMIPAYQHAFDKPLAPFEDRFALCEIAASIFGGRVRTSRIEAELGGASYTLRTVRAVLEQHPDNEWLWMIGADLVEERRRWHGWEELRGLIDFLVLGRGGAMEGQGDPLARDVRVPIELPSISSTEARARVARGEPTSGLLDAAVRELIDRRGLYRERP